MDQRQPVGNKHMKSLGLIPFFELDLELGESVFWTESMSVLQYVLKYVLKHRHRVSPEHMHFHRARGLIPLSGPSSLQELPLTVLNAGWL